MASRHVQPLLAVVLAFVMAVVALPATAMASPSDDLDTVRKKAHALGVRVSEITEDYNKARLELAGAKRKYKKLTSTMDRQRAYVERLRHSISAVAATAYMNGPADMATLATSETPQDFVDRATSMEQLSRHDQARMESYAAATKRLASERRQAAGILAKQRKVTSKLKSKKDEVVATLAEQKAAVAKLEERADRAAERQQPDVPPVSGRAGAAIEFAKAQLGKPYEWGAEGPGSYDCSGLTMMAWKQGGVSLPHSSQAQYESSPHVDRSQLEPGDLVFFGSPIHHVGIYVGNDRMIAAPSTGKVVSYENLNDSYYRSEYTGATRPG